MTTENLPALIENLRHDKLHWICAFHYSHPGSAYKLGSVHRRPLTQKLVLVLGKPDSRLNAGNEAITVAPFPEGAGGNSLSPGLKLDSR